MSRISAIRRIFIAKPRPATWRSQPCPSAARRGAPSSPRGCSSLGFGQGFGLALLAAANPDLSFERYDFNPEHVAHARRLIEGARLSNVSVKETGFEEAAARGGDNEVDVVGAHGIFSWVSRQAQDAIVDILRQRLQPNGLAYISYNCMPGWAALAPIRQFMVAVKRRNPGSSERQLTLALDLILKFKQGNAAFFAASRRSTLRPSSRWIGSI
jgi:SAM-dependent methyltransferase